MRLVYCRLQVRQEQEQGYEAGLLQTAGRVGAGALEEGDEAGQLQAKCRVEALLGA